MKKNIIAIAVAAAMIAPAAAMADTTLYGKFHVSYDVLSGDNATNTQSGFSTNSSRIGIKGKEKINDSLSIIYQYETGFDAGQNGSFGASSGGLGGQRNTFIGATGGWGTVIAGRHDTPFKMMGRSYDLFGDTIGDSRNIISQKHGDFGWDLRPSQVVAYVTPDLMGFKAVVAYVNSWAPSDPTASPASPYNTKSNAWSLSAGYKIAGFGLDAAYEQHKLQAAPAPGMKDSQDAYRIGANYSIAGFKILGLYQDVKNVGLTSDDVKVYGVGAAYTFMGANTVKAQYFKADDISNRPNTGGDMWAVGYDYKLSKQTNVYAMYAQTSNSSAASYTIMGGGHDYSYPTDTAAFPGGKSSAVSVGIEHKF
ncbi:porin [Halothiobacillus sp.]|uniref:porin n=1 Tax=Halothiobacillus sp. TaxID=1891311 RepID=UPI002639B02D|nr:porin [Halothiobacillus sp.]MDD3577104.1 porin [Halothiobacillus sp.]MDD4965727.1 porin [Halothiobacillus sp.]